MVSAPVVNMTGGEVGKYEFDSADLAGDINKQLLHDAVVMYEANRRVGTVKTKSRGMVAGSTAKLYRQKGTGRARAGSARTPVRRGGGHTFAKVNRDYSFRMPKKALRKATRMAVLSKFQDDQAFVVDSLAAGEPKTKIVDALIRGCGLNGKSVLLVTNGVDSNVWKSGRNIAGVQVLPVSDLNTYDVLRQRFLVIAKDAIDAFRSGPTPAAVEGVES